jgi:hypothetical protein
MIRYLYKYKSLDPSVDPNTKSIGLTSLVDELKLSNPIPKELKGFFPVF